MFDQRNEGKQRMVMFKNMCVLKTPITKKYIIPEQLANTISLPPRI